VAQQQGLRVTFISGDVHLAGVGGFYTPGVEPEHDHRWAIPPGRTGGEKTTPARVPLNEG